MLNSTISSVVADKIAKAKRKISKIRAKLNYRVEA